MRTKRLLLLSVFFVVLGVLVTARSGGPAAVLGQGYTNAPGESNCSSCHSGGAYGTVTPQIEVFQVGTSTPVTAYTPGTQYDMKVTVNHTAGTPSRYGFQLTALKAGNVALAGYSNLSAGIQQIPANGRTYVEHSTPSASNQFTFRWTAPASGSGNVTFYASGNCVNNNGGSDGDKAASGSITLTEAVPLAVTGIKTDITCFGANNGSINITASGGTPGYTYLWSDGSTLEDRTNLAPGNYSVTVSDAAAAQVTSNTFTISQPAAPLHITLSVGAIACSGGSATVVVGGIGGTPSYTNTGTFTLAPGTYTRVITDQKGCTDDTTFTIGPAPAPINVTVTPNGQLPCNGNGTTVTVTATGGTGQLTGVGTFQVFTAGLVSYQVTDANNCTGSGSVTVTAVSGLSVTPNVLMPDCNDTCAGVLSATVQTGSLPYTESLTTVPGGAAITNDSTLCPGDYLYHVTDNAGCEFTFNFTIDSPQHPSITVGQITQANGGNNGSVDITVSGGETPYTYSWSNGTTNEDLTAVGAGVYSITVTGANACTDEVAGIEVFDLAGIEEFSALGLSVFPNPFQGSFQLSDATWKVVAIHDVAGRTVRYVQNGQNVVIQNPARGIYLIQLKRENKSIILRMISE